MGGIMTITIVIVLVIYVCFTGSAILSNIRSYHTFRQEESNYHDLDSSQKHH